MIQRHAFQTTIPDHDIISMPREQLSRYLQHVTDDLVLKAGKEMANIAKQGRFCGDLRLQRAPLWDFDGTKIMATFVSYDQIVERVHIIDENISAALWNGFGFCPYCGCKHVKEDRFHSGTCENCGGRLEWTT